jgi:hypothetical protein
VIPAAWMAPILAALAAISAAAGFGLGHHLAALDGEAEVALVKQAYAHERQVALTKLLAVQATERARLQAEAQAAQEAEARAVEAASASDAQISTLKRSLFHANQYRPAPAAPLVDRPRCVITWGDVGLLNAAAAVPSSAGVPPGADAGVAAAPAGADAALDSGLAQRELYDWQLDYAGRCRGIEAQLNGLIDLTMKREKP